MIIVNVTRKQYKDFHRDSRPECNNIYNIIVGDEENRRFSPTSTGRYYRMILKR